MNKRELLRRLKGIEWDDFEVKESFTDLPKNIWKTVSAFSNTSGGVIVFGIREQDGKFVITGVENPDKMQNEFVSTLRGEKFNIPLSSKGHIYSLNKKKVLLFSLEEMPRQAKPIYYGGDIRNTYIRMAGSSQKASKQEVERLLREASEKSSDSMILEDFGIEDFDQESINAFLRYLKAEHDVNPILSLERKEILLRLQAIVKKKGKYYCTAAGMLFFGKEVRLLNQFPSYFIDFLVVPAAYAEKSPQQRWTERYSSEQNIMQTFIQIYDRLRKRIPVPFRLRSNGFFRDDDPPQLQAVREALVNLLMHMDYFDSKGACIRVYDDMIEMKNAGCLLFSSDRLLVENITEPRNPIIAKTFRLLGLADRTGEGIFKIINGWEQAGYGKPVISDDKQHNSFTILLPLINKRQRHGRVGTKQGLSWDQVGTKLGLSKEDVYEILKLCQTVKGITEIMGHMQFKNRTKFREGYINVLLKEGLLEMTVPQKPRSSKQKYKITEKGKGIIRIIGE